MGKGGSGNRRPEVSLGIRTKERVLQISMREMLLKNGRNRPRILRTKAFTGSTIWLEMCAEWTETIDSKTGQPVIRGGNFGNSSAEITRRGGESTFHDRERSDRFQNG